MNEAENEGNAQITEEDRIETERKRKRRRKEGNKNGLAASLL